VFGDGAWAMISNVFGMATGLSDLYSRRNRDRRASLEDGMATLIARDELDLRLAELDG